NILSTVLYFAGTIAGGLFFLVKGIIAGRYLAFMILLAAELYVVRKELRLIWSARSPLKQDRKEFLKFSFVVTLTNSISQFLYLIDIFFIGLIIKDESVVAAYKTATMIPFALAFLPQSIMLFLYPYFARNIKNKQKNKKLFYKVQGYMIIFNLGISLILIVFAPLIIKIIFGPQYSDSVLPFRILSFGFFVSACFRIIPGNVLASLRKVKINLYTGIITGTLNIILDIILIQKMGSVGAAIATTSMFILDALITNIYLYYFFKK
ncbi:MAG: polysaccharide biosynthesis C-terminal domain-containing protein, partial [Acidobacteriota bacterium]